MSGAPPHAGRLALSHQYKSILSVHCGIMVGGSYPRMAPPGEPEPEVRATLYLNCIFSSLVLLRSDLMTTTTLPNLRIMIHRPLGGAQGQAADIEIQVKEILFICKVVNTYIAKYCRQP